MPALGASCVSAVSTASARAAAPLRVQQIAEATEKRDPPSPCVAHSVKRRSRVGLARRKCSRAVCRLPLRGERGDMRRVFDNRAGVVTPGVSGDLGPAVDHADGRRIRQQRDRPPHKGMRD